MFSVDFSSVLDLLLMFCFLFSLRTYHNVIAGEHNKGYGSNEDVQILKPARVSYKNDQIWSFC